MENINIVINPGVGPVESGSMEQSEINILALIKDVGLENVVYRYRKVDEDGRHFYEVYYKANLVEVNMPALALDKVRYMGETGQNIWHFPRLYIGGSSWIWSIAIDVLRGHLTDDGSDDE